MVRFLDEVGQLFRRRGGVIGAEHTEDRETERNDRLLAVGANSVAHRSITS
jgi:hypothetical protein